MFLRTISRTVLAVALALSGAAAVFAGNGRFTPIGPEGGPAAVIRVDPWNPQTVYAAAGLGGVFKSTDGARSWRRLPAAVPFTSDQNVVGLVLDPTAPSTLYITFGNTVRKSRDGGATFVDAGAGIDTTFVSFVYDLEIDPAHPAVLYAGTNDGLYKTEDGGGSWHASGPAAGNLRFITSVAVDPLHSETVFLGTRDYDTTGIYKSTDGGTSWVEKTVGLPAELAGQSSVQVVPDPQTPGRVFASYIDVYSQETRSFRSTDGGETWTEIPGVTGFPLAAARGGLVFAGRSRSTDGGTTWTDTPVPGVQLASFAFDAGRPGLVYSGSATQGISQSTDGGRTWKATGPGFWATEVSGLAVDTRAPGVLFAGVIGERLWALPLAGQRFRLQAQATSSFLSTSFRSLVPDPRSPRVLYAAYLDTLRKSTDGGKTFSLLPFSLFSNSCYQLNGITVDPTDSEIVYVAGTARRLGCDEGRNTWRSTDGGASFSPMVDLGRASHIYSHPGRLETLYATSSSYGVFRSTNHGASWRELSSSEGFTVLAFDPDRPNVLYGGGTGGVSKSTDGGRTWAQVSRGFSSHVAELIVDPRAPETLYAAVSRYDSYPDGAGVYRSRDGGRTWSRIPGLPGELFEGHLAFDPIRGVLYAGTVGQGVHAATMPR